MRSKLFVPALRVDLYEKALRSQADAVCFDLEDSVLPAQRSDARAHLRTFLAARHPGAHPTLLVRVNPVGSEDFPSDLAAVVWPSVFGIALPKVEDKEDVMQAAEAIGALEGSHGVSSPTALLPTIESPRGLRLAHSIACSTPRVVGLQIGFADLLGALGIAQDDAFSRNQARWSVQLAAAEAGLPCYDSAYPNYKDLAAYEEELQSSRALGFAGASCIHPSQIPVANRTFRPTEEEVIHARRIVEAVALAEKEGRGVTSVDGRMIDRPFLLRAEEILRQAVHHDEDTPPSFGAFSV